jgi:hypothetical protein
MRLMSTIAYASAFAYATCVLSVAVAKGAPHGSHVHSIKSVNSHR